VKKPIVIFFLVVFVLSSCSDKDDSVIRIDPYDLEVIEYFQEIALGFDADKENSVTHKWKADAKIFIGGQPSTANITEIEKIIAEVNQLATDGFSIEIVPDSIQANFYVYVGTAAQYGKIFPTFAELATTNVALFNVYWNSENYLRLALVFIDNEKSDSSAQTHFMRMMVTRSLGLTNTSYNYYESIFFGDSWQENKTYTKIDRDLIRLLYHPEMTAGIKGDTLKNTLLTILINEK